MEPVDDRGREVSRLFEGRYEVLGLLGRGGFAAVYQIKNLRLRRLEALKVVAGSHEQNEEFIQRFEQESRVAASLEHPNILKVYDFGHDGGILWYSMPFIDGPTVTAELRRRGTFDEEAAARIVVPLLDALEYSHGRGVIHRDIKLDNILLDRRDRPYLMDFGIAKTDDSLVKTQTGFVLGSPAYISPEQLRGERLDGRTDVYALGVSLFQMIAGSVPFRSDRVADLANRLVMDAPRLASRRPDVHPEMDRIVAAALARVRDERYAGAREMRRDLESFLDTLRAPAPPAPAAASDPASMEDTASVPAFQVPTPIEPPPPAPRRVSAVVAVPSTVPAPPVAPPPESPAPRSRPGLVAGAVALLFLAAAGALFLARRFAPREETAAPVPTATPAAVAPTPAVAAPLPTAVPSPLPTRPAAPSLAPTAEPVRTPSPAPTATAPRPAPSPTRVPVPTAATVPTAARERPTPRPAPTAEIAVRPGRRIVIPPDVDEVAPVVLTPEQQRACGGQVVGVSVVVGSDGALKSKRVISSVSPDCDALALDVLARYRFRPARDDRGSAAEGRFAFTVQF